MGWEGELIRADPPLRRTKGSPIAAWLHAIKAHPGEWFQYPERVNQATAASIKQGRYADINPGEFDAVVRNTDKGSRGDVFACYLRRDQ